MSPSKPQSSAHESSIPQGVPLLDIARENVPLARQFDDAIRQVIDSGRFVFGPDCQQLETSLAAACQVPHAVGCASGSDALLLALMALDIGAGDEVICPSFTFFATASAVWRLGAKPVFVDIDPATYNIDPAQIAAAVTSNTKAIIPVHLFGQCAEMDAILDLASESGVAVIEDACQAIGSAYRGRPAGSLGTIGCFSFYPTKNLGGFGDGGAMTTHSDTLAARLQLLRGHGMQPRYYHSEVGINSRLDTLQAAALNVKLPQLGAWSEMRRANAARYEQLFQEQKLDQVIGLPRVAAHQTAVWNQYTIRVPDGRRDALREHLAAARIGSEIYYPVPLHEQACFQSLGYAADDLPETHRAAGEVLSLPIFPQLTADEQATVVSRVASFFHDQPHAGPSAPKFMSRSQGQRRNA